MKQQYSTGRPPKARGYSIIDVLVCLVLLLATATVLMPALAHADEESPLAVCLSRAKAMATACLSYAADHGGLMPGDGRDPDPDDTVDEISDYPQSEEAAQASWFGRLGPYRGTDASAWDCPNVDDHRKGEWWSTDYVLNRWAVNTSVDIADEPARAVLIGEPNMARGGFSLLIELIAWAEWGPRPDLEQHQVGSLAFAFADGHASRVQIADGASPHLAEYPDLFLAAPGEVYTNFLWWTVDQTLPVGE